MKPRQVVRDLLAAAGDPGVLDAATATQARLQAAEILLAAGDQANAAAVARRAAEPSGTEPDRGVLLALALILAKTGDPDDAANLATRGAAAVRSPGYATLGGLLGVAMALAAGGYFDHALRVCDENLGLAGRGSALDDRIARLIGLAAEQITALRAQAEATGYRFPARPAPPEPPDPELAIRAAARPPWPALTRSCRGWWPEAEYARIVRQLPQIGSVLGQSWPEHIARTESAMREAAATNGTDSGLTLSPLDFPGFVAYLTRTASDPTLAPVMTDYAWSEPTARRRARRGHPEHVTGAGAGQA